MKSILKFKPVNLTPDDLPLSDEFATIPGIYVDNSTVVLGETVNGNALQRILKKFSSEVKITDIELKVTSKESAHGIMTFLNSIGYAVKLPELNKTYTLKIFLNVGNFIGLIKAGR